MKGIVFMKKLISVILVLVFSLCGICSFAANATYSVDSAGISISLPDDMYVFTRKTSPDDEHIAALGLSYDGLMSAFDAKSMYLEAMDTENFNEIVVICEDTTDTNFYELGYDGLYNAVMAEEEAIEKGGRKIESADLYESNHVDFAKIVSSGSGCQVEYTTVYNQKKVRIKFLDFDGSFTDDEAEFFENIIDTVQFTEKPINSKSDKEPESNSEIDGKNNAVQATADPDLSSDASGASALNMDELWKIIGIIAVAIAICTIPALLFRFVFSGGGMSRGGAAVFAIIYSLVMAALFYYAPQKIPQLEIGTYVSIIPLIWGFVIYKIVKR